MTTYTTVNRSTELKCLKALCELIMNTPGKEDGSITELSRFKLMMCGNIKSMLEEGHFDHRLDVSKYSDKSSAVSVAKNIRMNFQWFIEQNLPFLKVNIAASLEKQDGAPVVRLKFVERKKELARCR